MTTKQHKFKVGDNVWFKCFWCGQSTVEGKVVLTCPEAGYQVSCHKGHKGVYLGMELISNPSRSVPTPEPPKFKIGDRVRVPCHLSNEYHWGTVVGPLPPEGKYTAYHVRFPSGTVNLYVVSDLIKWGNNGDGPT